MIDFFRKLLGQKNLNYYHLAAAVAANLIYGFPSRKLRVIGVTGTDGKTTTVNLIAGILKEAGLKVSFLSTINARIGDKEYDTGLHTTTPSPFLLQKLLSQMVKNGSRYAVLEVTSHALDQFRTWGINFETAVATNITHEHLDYHKTYEEYARAKAKLFQNVEYGILNMEDKSFEYLKNSPSTSLTYGVLNAAQVWAEEIREELKATDFIVHYFLPSGDPPQGDKFPIHLNLQGRFNVYNALAAICVGSIYKVPREAIQKGLEKVSAIPGRMEFIDEGQDFYAMVDFAHTPNALHALFSFLRPKVAGKLIVVFGAAGERDSAKRPLMGRSADEVADLIILTREDNRSEYILEICKQIASGIQKKVRDRDYFVIPDRREALGFALRQARSGDLVVICGKGHEQSLNIDGAEIPWDDRKVMREELKKLNVEYKI
ncbi:MAG: UDP-N-acetylmuramoyl-L-alanyl-D-glutamate--2,6-diaminopimelate ligase [Candidatus Doudnabacteria bacterium]|nr:UDP-N-acetylmuramoyl-L-alanyl-D-glutamate--2,6-diaminopimelate ligase [bacterium]MDZ4244172.1 UDP-N-acetylmuramoyl-L-alanyl-D-glutamate--2,6-diaminopimelate ligase [Candidatus Doudnabacteria bacterium]